MSTSKNTTHFEVTANGIPMGIYEAADEDGALEAYAHDSGYKSWADACEVAPVSDGEVVVTPVPADASTTLTGHDAIAYAEQHGLTLGKHADPLEAAREGVTVEEARQIAAEDPSLVYLAVES